MRLSLEKNNNNNNKRSRFNRVLCTIGARSLIKAASSDGRDLALGSPPTGDFRKTGNGEQYAFKKVNIEECIKVIYMYQTCCQLVAQYP